jgi:hypothetical protein
MVSANSFEGGTDGVAISVANSGAASGDAFTAIVNSPVPTFTTTQFRGTTAMKIVDAASTTDVEWRWASMTATVWSRHYLYLTALPTGATLKIVRVISDTGGGRCAEFAVGTSGVLVGLNAANAALVTGSIAVALNQWVRIETRVFPSTTVGEVEWRLYNVADSSTITDSGSASAAVLAADIEGVRFGEMSGNPTAPYTIYMDDLAVSDVGWIGPSGVQTLVPDADAAEGGWTTAPLFSKVNDSSDATFITATAS